MNRDAGVAGGLMVKLALKAVDRKIDLDTDTRGTQALMLVRVCMSWETRNVVHLLSQAHKLSLLISATRANGDEIVELNDYCQLRHLHFLASHASHFPLPV